MLKKMFRRIKSQKGMSGVLVALLLVVVGVALVTSVSTFMKDANNELVNSAVTKLNKNLTNELSAADYQTE